jgi:hypothetical protein
MAWISRKLLRAPSYNPGPLYGHHRYPSLVRKSPVRPPSYWLNAIVKDIALLKQLFKAKMESKAPPYLKLIEHDFNDKDVDIHLRIVP